MGRAEWNKAHGIEIEKKSENPHIRFLKQVYQKTNAS